MCWVVAVETKKGYFRRTQGYSFVMFIWQYFSSVIVFYIPRQPFQIYMIAIHSKYLFKCLNICQPDLAGVLCIDSIDILLKVADDNIEFSFVDDNSSSSKICSTVLQDIYTHIITCII